MEQRIVEKNDKAPFSGVLVPEHSYRYMQQEIKAGDLLTKELIKCHKANETFDNQIPDYIVFSFGLLSGVITGMIMSGGK